MGFSSTGFSTSNIFERTVIAMPVPIRRTNIIIKPVISPDLFLLCFSKVSVSDFSESTISGSSKSSSSRIDKVGGESCVTSGCGES